jgi:hypothetical protein
MRCAGEGGRGALTFLVSGFSFLVARGFSPFPDGLKSVPLRC